MTAVPTFPPPAAADVGVTVLMPCLDEVKTLPGCIRSARRALDTLESRLGLSGEILVSDNGSCDGSQALAESLGARVVDCPVRGYGAALRYGMLLARGRFIVMGDADGSYDFEDGVGMVEKLSEGYELCMGSRFKGRIEPGAMPWKNRYIGNPLLTGVLNLFFHSALSDAHCGLRALTKEAFSRIDPSAMGMEFASEMVIKATLLDCKRTEVPIVLHPDGRGRPPHLRPFSDGWRHLRYLIMLSPAWLYLVPGMLLLLAGAALLLLLLQVQPGSVFSIGPIWFGDHWLPIAMAMTAGGHLSILFALATTLVGIRGGYRRLTPLLKLLYRCSRLEVLLLMGIAFLAVGGAVTGSVALAWVAEDFGPLRRLREMMAGATALTLGIQSFFGAFLLSIIAGNDADLEQAVQRAMRRKDRGAGAG